MGSDGTAQTKVFGSSRLNFFISFRISLDGCELKILLLLMYTLEGVGMRTNCTN